MVYNAEVHRRRSIRLRDFDYTHVGAYFMTICAWQRECLFGEMVDGVLRLNVFGEIVQKCWVDMPNHFPNVELDVFTVMPNHVHGIIMINDPVGERHASPDFPIRIMTQAGANGRATHASPLRGAGPIPRSIGAMVGAFKSAVTKHINHQRNNPGAPVWQRNYYERVIRDEAELHAVRQYINDNPIKWAEDENHPTRLSP
ncbi:MAG TPA: transposase [Pelovirga sp.]|nr:transposase [Pelovirga sp.]